MCKTPHLLCTENTSEEEGERYLMLEEHKHANNSHDNTCLTLPDNHISVTTTCQSSGPSIVELTDQPCLADTVKHATAESCIEELNEENLEKTACFNGELDQQPSTTLSSQGLSLASSLENGYLCNGSGQYHSVVNGYQQNGMLPRYHSAGNQQYQKQARDQTAASPCADSRSRVSGEGSPESTSSTMSPCSQHDTYSYSALDQGFTSGNSYIARDACHSNHSYSEDGGYESATSPYSASYLSPQILSPGSLNADSRTDCGYSDHSLRKDVSQCQSSVFAGGYSGPGVCGNTGLLQGGNSHTMNKDDTAELRETENILEALLESFDGQTEANQLDTTLAAICSTIDNFTNQNSPAVTTHVKSPGIEKHKHRSAAGLGKNNKPKDKSLLRSILTMPEDDIPKHSITFLKNAKSQNTTPSSDLSGPCSEARKINNSGSAQNVTDKTPPRKPKTGSTPNTSVYPDMYSCPDKNGTLDLQEMPSDITDFALQYLDTLTEDQTQAVIADLNTETLMDTSESDFKKELFSTITCQSPDNNFHSSCDIVSSQSPYSQSYISPLRSKQGMPQYSQTVSSSATCTSSKSASFPPNVSSSHDHVYHQANKFGGNGVRQVAGSQTAGGCSCSPKQSQFTQTRSCNSSQMSDSQISELEKHLRDTNDVYQPGLQFRPMDEVGTTGRPFLRQLLTGELTKDRYIQMERERCGYSKGIRPQ